jgi:uncharacterized radical SAM protein YgiQ
VLKKNGGLQTKCSFKLKNKLPVLLFMSETLKFTAPDKKKPHHGFLPLNKNEFTEPGEVDVVLVTGDAYVDHPSFGAAVIGRVLKNEGWRVGIIAMPEWNKPESITTFGKPRLFFGITSGNVDSMVANYTSFKRQRSDDPYAPGGSGGNKPDRAVIVYANLVRRVYKDVPIIIGGIEASMRRAAHYDFWSNKVRRSIIQDSRAAVLVHGMGEFQVLEIARRIDSGKPLSGIPGTVFLSQEAPEEAKILPPEEDVIQSKEKFNEFYRLFYLNQHRVLAQPAGKRFIVHYPSYDNLSSGDLDKIYELPYMREPHPIYKKKIPAFEMICNSLTAHRGCVSGCSFCSLTLHQGKKIISRTPASVLREVDIIAKKKYFKGHITDIGGPSANMYGFSCKKKWRCPRESCLFPTLCANLEMSSAQWLDLLSKAAGKKNVTKVTIGSGIRYDLLLRHPATGGKEKNSSQAILKSLIDAHISGQLKIAPEHMAPVVLRAMRKIPLFDLKKFVTIFSQLNAASGKKQYLLPYLMSCHPGSNKTEMRKLKDEIRTIFGIVPRQVQAFLPLPMTLSSVIYYTGIDPLTGERFHVEKNMDKRRQEHNIFFD